MSTTHHEFKVQSEYRFVLLFHNYRTVLKGIIYKNIGAHMPTGNIYQRLVPELDSKVKVRIKAVELKNDMSINPIK